MEYQKITNLLSNIPEKVSRFVTKKWIEVPNQFGGPCNINKQIRFKTSIFQSDLCDYSDAYIAIKGTITVKRRNNVAYDKKLAFKNNALLLAAFQK